MVELDGEEYHAELTQVSMTLVDNMQVHGERTNHSSDDSPYQKKCDGTAIKSSLQRTAISTAVFNVNYDMQRMRFPVEMTFISFPYAITLFIPHQHNT